MEPTDSDFTLHGMLRGVVQDRGAAPALTLGEDTVTFAELQTRARAVAAGLRDSGVRAEDRVAVLARNAPDYFTLLFACSALGAVLVGLNWRLSSRELGAVVADAEPRVVIADAEFADAVTEAARACSAVLLDMADGVATLAEHDGSSLSEIDTDPDSVVLQLYSSGTTGTPKGILLTHRNLSLSSITARRLYDLSPDSTNMLISPLFHIGGVGYALPCITLGGHTVMAQEVSAEHLLDTIERHQVTHCFQVPSVIQTVVDSPLVTQHDHSSLRSVFYGGAPMSPALLARARAALGCAFVAVYGMTETSGTVIALTPEQFDESRADVLLNSIGKPLPWLGEAVVADLLTGEPCPPGVVGEIWVRSPQVTPGYWRQPATTAEVIRPDGWLRTGDAAYVDEDGYFFLHDRLKDMIISGGENVFPAEVEAVILELPDVSQCAVIGVPSERWGETVKAVIVPRPGQRGDEAAVIRYCRNNLAHYKCPTSVDVVDELPYNASGKVLKVQLRKRFSEMSATT